MTIIEIDILGYFLMVKQTEMHNNEENREKILIIEFVEQVQREMKGWHKQNTFVFIYYSIVFKFKKKNSYVISTLILFVIVHF